MSGARIAILSAPADEAWRDAAATALAGFRLQGDDPVDCVVLVWTARAAVDASLEAQVADLCPDVVVWRPDGAPAPRALAHAYPLGPEMGPRALRLLVQFALDEAARRDRSPLPRRAWGRKGAIFAGVAGAVVLTLAGLSLYAASSGPHHESDTARPVAGLRDRQ